MFTETVISGAGKKIAFIRQMGGNGSELPSAEVALDTADTALEIRQRFVETRKTGIDYGRISMTNVSTLATRIRVDILFLIVKECSKEDEKMFVRQYISRPVLLIKPKDKNEYALTYADAVQRYGNAIKDTDFTNVYKRIGRAFPDQLEQTFVVIGESGRLNFEQPRPTSKRSIRSDKKFQARTDGGRGRGGGGGWAHRGGDGRGRGCGGQGGGDRSGRGRGATSSKSNSNRN